MDGEAHNKLRRAFQRAFTPRAYQFYLPLVHKMMTEFLDGWEKQSANIPIYPPLKNLTLTLEKGILGLPINLWFTRLGKAIRAKQEICTILKQVLEKKKQGKQEKNTKM